jgi:hypothetical protein
MYYYVIFYHDNRYKLSTSNIPIDEHIKKRRIDESWIVESGKLNNEFNMIPYLKTVLDKYNSKGKK